MRSFSSRPWHAKDAAPAIDVVQGVRSRTRPREADAARSGELWRELQELMWNKVGVLRTGDGLADALARIRSMRIEVHDVLGHHGDGRFDMELQDVFDLGAALLTAETVALAAIERSESRGAHQREDLPDTDPALERNQLVRLDGDGNPVTEWCEVIRAEVDLAPVEAAE